MIGSFRGAVIYCTARKVIPKPSNTKVTYLRIMVRTFCAWAKNSWGKHLVCNLPYETSNSVTERYSVNNNQPKSNIRHVAQEELACKWFNQQFQAKINLLIHVELSKILLQNIRQENRLSPEKHFLLGRLHRTAVCYADARGL